MWKTKDLKINARKSLKANYWFIVAVCFIMAMFAGAYGCTASSINDYNSSDETKAKVAQQTVKEDKSASSTAENFVEENTSSLGGFVSLVVGKWAGNTADGISPSESPIYKFLYGFDRLFKTHDISGGVVFLVSGMLGLAYYFFLINILIVGEARFFMETRVYTETKLTRLFFLYKSRKIINPAKIIFFRDLFTFLWSLTIVGGCIKHYSYFLIPYIVAENPNISRKEAFLLSRKIMNGHKWHTFLMTLSFLGWNVLVVLTFGLVGIFYSNGYMQATYTELYMTLRRQAIADQLPGFEALNDKYIETPPQELLDTLDVK
ncbi:MAG: DUF975 family protein [Anaerovoracaceae bacterium]